MVNTKKGDKFISQSGCLVGIILFVLSIVGLVISIDEKTGKVNPDKYLYLLPTGFLLIFLFGLLLKSLSRLFSEINKLPSIINNISENEFPGKNGIRGKLIKIAQNPIESFIGFKTGMNNPLNFICPNCLKTILAENVGGVICPYCDAHNEGIFSLFSACPKCGGIIKYYECPHCKEDIDLLSDYNEEILIKKRLQ